MSVTKIGSAMQDLTDNYAFSGTVTGTNGTWNLIGTQVASSDASLTQTGLDATYENYAIVLSEIIPSTDAEQLFVRFGDSGGVDSASSDYAWHTQIQNDGANSYVSQFDADDSEINMSGSIGSTGGEGLGAIFYIQRPGGTSTVWPTIHGLHCEVTETPVIRGGITFGGRQSPINMDRVQILFTNGIASGRFSVYGIAHS